MTQSRLPGRRRHLRGDPHRPEGRAGHAPHDQREPASTLVHSLMLDGCLDRHLSGRTSASGRLQRPEAQVSFAGVADVEKPDAGRELGPYVHDARAHRPPTAAERADVPLNALNDPDPVSAAPSRGRSASRVWPAADWPARYGHIQRVASGSSTDLLRVTRLFDGQLQQDDARVATGPLRTRRPDTRARMTHVPDRLSWCSVVTSHRFL